MFLFGHNLVHQSVLQSVSLIKDGADGKTESARPLDVVSLFFRWASRR